MKFGTKYFFLYLSVLLALFIILLPSVLAVTICNVPAQISSDRIWISEFTVTGPRNPPVLGDNLNVRFTLKNNRSNSVSPVPEANHDGVFYYYELPNGDTRTFAPAIGQSAWHYPYRSYWDPYQFVGFTFFSIKSPHYLKIR